MPSSDNAVTEAANQLYSRFPLLRKFLFRKALHTLVLHASGHAAMTISEAAVAKIGTPEMSRCIEALRRLSSDPGRLVLATTLALLKATQVRLRIATATDIPEDPMERAMLLFFFSDWSHYTSADPTQKNLAGFYTAVTNELRQRMLLHAAGNDQGDVLLTLLLCHDSVPMPMMRDCELQRIIALACASVGRERLWKNIDRLPPKLSMMVLEKLREKQFKPSASDEAESFDKLSTLATSCRDRGEPTKADLGNTTGVRDLVSVLGPIQFHCFSPDSAYVFANRVPHRQTPHDAKRACLFSAQSGAELAQFPGGAPSGPSVFAPFSRNSRFVLTSHGPQAWISEAHTGRLQATLPKHRRDINSAQFSPNGHLAVTADGDGAQVSLSMTGALISVLNAKFGYHNAVFTPDSKLVLARNMWSIDLWAPFGGAQIASMSHANSRLSDASLSPRGDVVVTIGETDRRVRLWSIPSGRRLFNISLPADGSAADFSPDGELLLVSTTAGASLIIVVSTGKVLRLLPGVARHANLVLGSPFSLDSSTVLTVSSQTLYVWGLPTCELLSTSRSPHSVYNAALSSDGHLLAQLSVDRHLCLWSLPLGRLLQTLAPSYASEARTDGDPYLSVALAPNDRSICFVGKSERQEHTYGEVNQLCLKSLVSLGSIADTPPMRLSKEEVAFVRASSSIANTSHPWLALTDALLTLRR